MEFKLNGNTIPYEGDPEMSLMTYLRDEEGIISPKDGCAPEGVCGCCTVLMDGNPLKACIAPMRRIEGKEIVTMEGLDEDKKETVVKAFAKEGGLQCGFCTPGIIMKIWPLFNQPFLTEKEVDKALNSNLCRCTGYKKITKSCLAAAEALRNNGDYVLPEYSGKVGESLPKYDSLRLATGEAPYVADLKVDGMVHGALKFSEHPRAKVLKINTANAEKMDGVLSVFTADDIPGERFTGLIVQDWPLMVKEGETTRYVGDILAGVVAETEKNARDAAALIEVEYEVLTPVIDASEALKDKSPKIHESGNLLSTTEIKRGDCIKAEKESAFVSKGTYKTQRIEHAFMELECCVAKPLGDGIEVYSQGQGVYEDRNSISKILGLPLEKVSVSLMPNGGAFGGKEDISVQGHASLFAYLLQLPVRVILTRPESLLMHPKRHPMSMEMSMGCDKQGKMTFVKADIIGDTGAYASVGMKVLERAAGHATSVYSIPAVEILSRAAYTNNVPCGAMRGFGVNQINFAVESCLDELCEKGGFDRWQIRYDNTLKPGDRTSTGQKITSGIGIQKTLLAVKEQFQNAKYAGIACGMKNTGIGNGVADEGKVKVVIDSPTKITIHHGWTEMGQGVFTMAVQFLCEATGLNPDLISVKVDTSKEAPAGMTTASRGTSIIGNSVLDAGAKLKADLETHSLEKLVGREYEGEWKCDWTTSIESETDEPQTHYSYSYATQVVTLDESGKVDTVYAAHDAGRIINPVLFEGQLEGSVHMGLGYALSENFEMQEGRPKHLKLGKLGMIRAASTPKIVVIGVEEPDEFGPCGAKGVGEIGLVPTASAVSNAFFQYNGERQNELPLKKMTAKSAAA
ncbi:MAG: putative xanthine dehydrogenase subunit D [Deltaproteobacteria bacterium]|jgi:xanthine dehydrogenase molybdenum-binding subunit|nr:putative xanthine dehydrogenase subunit D [Deltaproteobacteria bacterium]